VEKAGKGVLSIVRTPVFIRNY